MCASISNSKYNKGQKKKGRMKRDGEQEDRGNEANQEVVLESSLTWQNHNTIKSSPSSLDQQRNDEQ